MLKTIVILTKRRLWECFYLFANLPLVIHWPQLATPNLSKGYGLVFSLGLFPSWWSHTDTTHSLFQEAHKPLHMFVLTGKIMFLPQVFSLFPMVFFAFTFSKVFTVLRATTNEISVPWESNTLFLMVLSYWLLHKQAVSIEEKEPDLPTTWNHLLFRGLSCVFV